MSQAVTSTYGDYDIYSSRALENFSYPSVNPSAPLPPFSLLSPFVDTCKDFLSQESRKEGIEGESFSEENGSPEISNDRALFPFKLSIRGRGGSEWNVKSFPICTPKLRVSSSFFFLFLFQDGKWIKVEG